MGGQAEIKAEDRSHAERPLGSEPPLLDEMLGFHQLFCLICPHAEFPAAVSL